MTALSDILVPLVASSAPLNWTTRVDLQGFAAATGIQGFFCPLRLAPVMQLAPASGAPLAAVTVSGDALAAQFSTPADIAGSYAFNLNVRQRGGLCVSALCE